ncbi:MAG: hypothetical protein EA409_01555 [Saprospirales bacterium]|nr:MAG: hypothetical protein EA409_01555 [Saprospirales bacterium]
MKKAAVFMISIFLPLVLIGQIVDRFDRGELTGGAIDWQGNTENFIINAQNELQLNDNQAGESSIFFSYQPDNSLQWDLYFRMEFNPSVTNRLRIFLVADDEDLFQGNAFYLDIGENGNNDPIYFIKQTDGSGEILAAMQSGAVAFDPAVARVRVIYDGNENWELQADYQGDSLFEDRIIVENQPIEISEGYFGLHCSYTVTRATLFFFNDLRIGKPIPDTTGPQLLEIIPLMPNSIELVFDKLLDLDSASDTEKYSVSGIGSPSEVFPVSDPGSRLELFFDDELENGAEYLLEINEILDLRGNASDISSEFVFVIPEIPLPGDIVINEIHSLPSSTTLIPEVKYVELFNSSDKFLQLGGLRFSDRTRTVTFNQGMLAPGEFLIICDISDVSHLESFGRVVGFSGFPIINNTSDDIRLEGQTGDILFSVGYRSDWFDDPLRGSGGYSLELINPFINCQSRVNWRLSEDVSGGSPGRANSVLNENFSPGIPELMFGTYSDAGNLGLHFSVELDRNILSQPPELTLSPAELNYELAFDPLTPNVLEWLFDPQPETGILYEIELQQMRSCGLDINQGVDRYSFKVPDIPLTGDLVINELLYNPPTGVRDFIELKNTSEDRYYRFSDLLIYHRRSNGTEATIRPSIDRIIAPEDLLTFGRETRLLHSAYDVENPFLLQDIDLPALDNNRGSIVLSSFHPDEVVYLDSIAYSENLHDPLLRNRRGISLERTDPNLSPSVPAAWYSAATISGGATPTSENSQRRLPPEQQEEEYFFLASRTFSPDGDGFEDFLQLEYRIDRPGYIANIKVFDMNGNLVNNLVRNKSLGTEGVILWRGENDRGEKARVGIYVILVELHNIDGNRKRQRLTAVLAERLN